MDGGIQRNTGISWSSEMIFPALFNTTTTHLVLTFFFSTFIIYYEHPDQLLAWCLTGLRLMSLLPLSLPLSFLLFPFLPFSSYLSSLPSYFLFSIKLNISQILSLFRVRFSNIIPYSLIFLKLIFLLLQFF